jgi:hyaluronan synthase
MSSDLQAVLPSFALPAEDRLPPGRAYRVAVGSTIVLGLAAILVGLLSGELFRPVRQAVEAGALGASILTPGLAWVSIGWAMMVTRTVLWLFYRPFPAEAHDSAPSMTVVIPAYNEGAMVEQSIESVAAARYPRGRLEILVVDDGSTDDTWTYIQRAAGRHPDLVTALKLERNQGKRVALATGFRAARGTILVTIDSDSVIEQNALLAMAGPFRDPRVGAVAGKVAVHNRDRGWIPRMLHVRFLLSFDFQRSSQSMYRTVYCCPGALAGYRASVVRDVQERWLDQRFLGAPCTYGEDRALTNAILERGFDTVYQGSAVVHTLVPDTYRQLCRMYLRWDRSHVREELRFLRIVWRRPPASMVVAVVEKLATNLGIPLGWTVVAMFATTAIADPLLLARILGVIGIGAAFSMLYYVYRERSLRFVHGILYSYFAFFALWWIFPWALMTVRSRSWMTR